MLDFINYVLGNYNQIKSGESYGNESGGENHTYLVQLTDGHNNTLFIQLSRDGSYWNINSAGVFKKTYGNNKTTVWSASEVQNGSSAPAVNASQSEPNADGGSTSNGTASDLVVGRDTSKSLNSNTSEEKKSSVPKTDESVPETDESVPETAESVPEEEKAEPKSEEEKLKEAEAATDTHPTDGQKEAGNYAKGHVRLFGMDLSIEQPKGSTRSGVDADGRAWSQEMHNTYGYIRGTMGRDKDHIDVFLGDNLESQKVFVVDQKNRDGSFDEHKVMLGFDSLEEARKAYLSNYEEGWQGLMHISETTLDEFRAWALAEGRRVKPFAEYHSVETLPKEEAPVDVELNGQLYNIKDLERQFESDIRLLLEDNGIEVNIKGVKLIGSRIAGSPRVDSDLDLLVEFEGDYSEDALFNILNEEAFDINGIKLDINPIKEGKSGTIAQFLERNRDFKKGISVETEVRADAQGNPVGTDGKLILESVSSVDELTDDDFTHPTRSVVLPTLPENVSSAVGITKPLIIKKNVFEKNRDSHKDLTASDSRKILREVLYSPDLYGQNQKITRPYNWILIHLADKNEAVIIEVNDSKDNTEIVNWHYLRGNSLEQKKKQAINEGGLILTFSKENAAGNAVDNLRGKDTAKSKSSSTKPEKTEEKSSAPKMWYESDKSSAPVYGGKGSAAKFNILKFVEDAKSEMGKLSPALTGVFHHRGEEVATNRHILIARRASYDRKLENIITGKKGEVIEGRYPNYTIIFPKEVKGTVAVEDMRAAYENAKLLRETYPDEFGKKTPVQLSVPTSNGESVRLSDIYVKLFLDLFDKSGGQPVITYHGSNRALTIEGSDYRALLMPMTSSDTYVTATEAYVLGEKQDKDRFQLVNPRDSREVNKIKDMLSTEDFTFSDSDTRLIIEANNSFNRELSRFRKDGDENRVFNLGKTGPLLRAMGFPEIDIEMKADRIGAKAQISYVNSHPFDPHDVENLVFALNSPIAVFQSITVPGAKVALLDIKHEGINFVASVEIGYEPATKSVKVNRISGLYPKDKVRSIMRWLGDESILDYVHKNKALEWLDQQQSNSADVDEQLKNLAANVIQSHDNSKLFAKNLSDTDEHFSLAEPLRPLKKGEKCYVERKFTEDHNFSFTGKDRIESLDDIAYIFRSLADTSIENSFLVFTDKDGKATIVHAGMGTDDAVNVDLGSLSVLAGEAEKIYMVHNHPGGNLKPSMQDRRMLENLVRLAGDKVQEGVIIDGPTTDYGTFDTVEGSNIRTMAEPSSEVDYKTYKFDKSVFDKEYNPSKSLRSAPEVAGFISSQRLGERSKIGVLTLDRDLHVRGNFFLPARSLSDTESLAGELSRYAAATGAYGVVLFGTGITASDKDRRSVEALRGRMTATLVDVLAMGGENTPVTQLLLSEGYPEMKYTAYSDLREQAQGGPVDLFQVAEDVYRKQQADERQSIKERALADGTFMKAPNGKPTKLSEDQWLTVRTRVFKRWFGDWELAAAAKKIIGMPAINTGKYPLKGTPEEHYLSIGVATNKYDNTKVQFDREVYKKGYKEGGKLEACIPALKDLFENSVLAFTEDEKYSGETRKNGTVHGSHRNFTGYRQYIGKAIVKGQEEYVRFTVRMQKGQNGVHNVFVTDIDLYEKPLLDASISASNGGARLVNGRVSDTKLENYFRTANNSSKIVDENGEPLVVYHGTTNYFNVFKTYEESGIRNQFDELPSEAFMFTEDPHVASDYGDPIEVFLNSTNPLDVREKTELVEVVKAETGFLNSLGPADLYLDEENIEDFIRTYIDSEGRLYRVGGGSIKEDSECWWAIQQALIDYAKENGYDSVIFKDSTRGEGHDSIGVFEGDQVKSAEPFTFDDNGELIPLSERFSDSNDIRYQLAYHGSGASFDHFDTDFMSTGEGNQDYGWGTYVATNEDTCRRYADIAANGNTEAARAALGPKDYIAMHVRNWLERDPLLDFDEAKEEVKRDQELFGGDQYTMDDIDAFSQSDMGQYGGRHLYSVEIPDDNGENYLHWDKPLTEAQRRKIVDALKAMPETDAEEIDDAFRQGIEGSQVEGGLNYVLGNERDYATGIDHGAERNSRLLGSLGFVGMQVDVDRNGGRRYMGDNFVLYNADDVKIIGHERFQMGDDQLPSSRKDIDAFDAQFNKELQDQVAKIQEVGHIYQLGHPGDILRATGFPDMPIELSATHLKAKSKEIRHPFDISEVEGLVKAINNPLAVFSYGNSEKAQNVITEIQHNGKNFLVGVHFNQDRRGLTVSDIRGLYPKDNAEWLNWISKELMLYLDKKRIQDLIAKQQKNLAEVDYLDLNRVAKLMNEFKNPNIPEKNNSNSSILPEPNYLHRNELSGHSAVKATGKVQSFVYTSFMGEIKANPLKRLMSDGFWRPYRQVVKNINLDNYYIGTDATFERVAGVTMSLDENGNWTSNRKEVDDLWQSMKDSGKYAWHKSPLSDSEYLIDEKNGDIYRYADHWGRVSSCNWYLDASTRIDDRGYDRTEAIAKANIKDFTLNGNSGREFIPDPRKVTQYLGALDQAIANYRSLSEGDEYKFTPKAEERLKGTLSELEALRADIDSKGLESVGYRSTRLQLASPARSLAAKFYEDALKQKTYRFTEGHQDSMRSLLLLQRAVERATGRELKDYENAYLHENAMSSKNQAQSEQYERQYIRPLQKAIDDLIALGASRKQVITYMMAKHGLERNALMSKRYGKGRDYAGLTQLTGSDTRGQKIKP